MKILLVGASGYIGSRIAIWAESHRHHLIGCDIKKPASFSAFSSFHLGAYQTLPTEYIRDCEIVLWFAGHSSVGQAQKNPQLSIENNVLDLYRFFCRSEFQESLIVYASTASVLSSVSEQYSSVANEARSNAYDSGKLSFDLLSTQMNRRMIGLRLSTVSGWSPSMRWDLVFNAMNKSAFETGSVTVSNSSNFRSLLFIDDLIQYIEKLIESPAIIQKPDQSRRIALASWSGSIGTLGGEIASHWKVPIKFSDDSGTYSFVCSDRDLKSMIKNPQEIYKSISERCVRFIIQNGWN